MAKKSKTDDQRVLALLDLLASYRARIVELERRADEVERVWRDIVEDKQ